jgi:FKBP-type peptidyl-prolyl cis-trans isomerase
MMRVSKLGHGESLNMNILLMTFCLCCTAMSSPAMSEDESTSPTESPASTPEVTQPPTDSGTITHRARTVVKQNRSLMKAAVANTKSGYVFLNDNQLKQGVVKLKSGLQYKVIKTGSGTKPRDEDVVRCRYRGTLIDGTVFEQSDPIKPANIQIAPLVPGLKEAIKLMPVGSKWEIYLPPELGFGSAGKPPTVGPDAVLIYELDLVGINSPTTKR